MVGYWLHESSEEKEMDSGRSVGRGLTVTEDLPEEAGRTRSFPVNGPKGRGEKTFQAGGTARAKEWQCERAGSSGESEEMWQ